MPCAYEMVYELVRQIPRGKVLTYGMVAQMLGGILSARGVGWALRRLASSRAEGRISPAQKDRIPWHRVINAAGGLSTHKNPDIPAGLQRRLLEQEGIKFDRRQLLDLRLHLWKGWPAHLVLFSDGKEGKQAPVRSAVKIKVRTRRKSG